jgi:hypothetical protein
MHVGGVASDVPHTEKDRFHHRGTEGTEKTNDENLCVLRASVVNFYWVALETCMGTCIKSSAREM